VIKVVLFDYNGVLSKMLVPQRQLIDLAKILKTKGIQPAIFSNVLIAGGKALDALGFFKAFDPVILARHHNYRKPHPSVYEHAVQLLGVKPNEIVFIDNLSENLVPAQELGMHIIHAKSTPQVAADIKNLLKKQNGLQL